MTEQQLIDYEAKYGEPPEEIAEIRAEPITEESLLAVGFREKWRTRPENGSVCYTTEPPLTVPDDNFERRIQDLGGTIDVVIRHDRTTKVTAYPVGERFDGHVVARRVNWLELVNLARGLQIRFKLAEPENL